MPKAAKRRAYTSDVECKPRTVLEVTVQAVRSDEERAQCTEVSSDLIRGWMKDMYDFVRAVVVPTAWSHPGSYR